jgi:hypothetical protein
MKRFFAEYVGPRLAKYKVLSRTAYDEDSGYGVTAYELVDQKGARAHFQLGSMVTTKGPKTSLEAVVGALWRLEAHEDGVPSSRLESFLRDRRRDELFRDDVAQFGIRGKLLPHGKVMAWDEYDRLSAVFLEKLRADEQRLAGTARE